MSATLPGAWHATDPFPEEDATATRLHPFFDHLRDGRLTTTRCSECGARPWPPRVLCPACWSDRLEWVDLPRAGIVRAFTVQETGVPAGFEKPLVLGIVDLDGVRIFARILTSQPQALQIGDEVAFTVMEIPPRPGSEEPRLLHAFTQM